MKADGFVVKWDRQRARGRWVYAAIHALVIGSLIGLIKLASPFVGIQTPERLTTLTVLYFALGGFAYGLIRFNIRERFYRVMKGPSDDRS